MKKNNKKNNKAVKDNLYFEVSSKRGYSIDKDFLNSVEGFYLRPYENGAWHVVAHCKDLSTFDFTFHEANAEKQAREFISTLERVTGKMESVNTSAAFINEFNNR